MPHRNESGKIITSKTPLLSSHSSKISSSSASSAPVSSSPSTNMKLKNNNNSSSNGVLAEAEDKLANHHPDMGMKNGHHNDHHRQHETDLDLMPSTKPHVLATAAAAAATNSSSSKEQNGVDQHSNLINGNDLSNSLNEQLHRQQQQNGEPEETAAAAAAGYITGEPTISFALNGKQTENEDEEQDGMSSTTVNGQESPSLKNGFLHFHPQIKEQCDVPCRKDFIKTLEDSEEGISRPKKIYRVVLTGGPCGGKTTGQARLCTFFENMGWKVYRVPEAATVLLGGGIKFGDLNEQNAIKFQEELLRTMMQIESVFFRMAEMVDQDVLIICDRGTMDASAFIKRSYWEDILARNNLNEVDIRDTRYNQIIHMVSAANGAEPFYTTEDHICRSEGIELARQLDKKAAQAWVGHPYFDVVDNSSDFEAKVCRMIQCVCQKLGIDAKDRLETNAKKVKFLLKGPLPPNEAFPSGFQDFTVVHDYLQTNGPKVQARLRKRGQKNHSSYTYTVRRPELQGQVVEVKTTLTQRDYSNMLAQRDHNHVTVYKNRRCFLLNNQYFQLDVYQDPCHPRCKGLILLETYSTLHGSELYQRLPRFLNLTREVTGDPRYSMFNLSLKENWINNKYFCQSLSGAVITTGNREEYTKSESQLAAGC